jgi:uncharacterized protein with FMN-binding domain
MKFPTRSSLFALAAVTFIGPLAIGAAEASQWFFSQAPDSAAAAAPVDTAAPVQLAAAAVAYRDGSYTGKPYDAYYGLVQVQASIQGGHLVSVKVLQFPDHSGTSRSINRRALPYLKSEVMQAQGVRVNLISGATLTSRAYLRSLNTALKQAGA